MIKFLIQICFICCVFSTQAQSVRVENINDDEYPTISGELITRDPKGLDTSRVVFAEGNSLLNVTFDPGLESELEPTGKCVLLLVLNHQAHRDRTKWYQEVIRSAIDKGLIEDGDEFAIQSFDCKRPEYNDPNSKLLFPETPVFVSSEAGLKQQVDNIDRNKKRFLHNCKDIGNIYGAIDNGLDVLDNYQTDLDKFMIVFADDLSIPREGGNYSLVNRAQQNDIAIYGITYYQIIHRQYGIEDICQKSFGKYFIDKSNNLTTARDALLDYGGSMFQRAQGISYPFRFETSTNKDGKTHAVKVTYKEAVTGFSYDTPSMTLWETLMESPILTGVGAGLLILLIVVLFYLRKKQKQRRIEQEKKQAEEMERIEREQQEASKKSSKQQEEIQRLKAQERRKKQQEKKAEEQARFEANEKATVELMSARGNLAWITYDFAGQKGSFEIDASEFVVGRNDDNDYQINHGIVSRKHFKINYENGGYKITDLNSANGTLLNGDPILVDVLKHGDVISIGDIHLTFHI